MQHNKPAEIEVEAVHRGEKLVLLADSTLRPFDVMIDMDGFETDDATKAVVITVKIDAEKWIVVDLRDFDAATTH